MGERYAELAALIQRVRNRWRIRSALQAWTLAAAATALVLGLARATQWLVAPDGAAFVALWLVAGAAAMVGLGWLIAPLRRIPLDDQVARFIEECCPDLEDALVTAVAQRDTPNPAPIAAMVADDAARRARGVDIDRIISGRALRRAGWQAAGATVALCIAGVLAAGPAARAAHVALLYAFPARVALDVTPGDVKLRAGDPLRIVARIPGAASGVVPVLRIGEDGEWRESRMDPGTDGFAVALDRVDESFSYSVTAAGAASREYTITVIRPPRVERIALRYEYPPAFGMKPREEEDGGDIYGPAGTRVRIAVHADKPVTEGALTLGGGQRVPLTPNRGVLEGELTIGEDGSYRVALADGDGLSSPGETEYFIRTLEDRPPDVRIVRPASDRQVTPIEEVSIEARADDDFGIASMDLVYAVRGASEKVAPFRRSVSGTSVNGQLTVYLEDLDVKPGDFVTYYARARDVSRGKRSTEARSDIFFLEVTPFEEEFVASQSQGAGSGGDRSLDDMVQAQKDIISATWKLDSRGRQSGGRSPDDIRTVATAQRELRTRAAAAVAQMQRANNLRRVRPGGAGGGGRAVQAPADAGAEAMTRAAAAMGQAEQRLESLKTADALPHEMTALNELLRAQAEVRRREVQQQQANGNGRGSNRQQQDLSSLFDRELARQQQTNYETPTSRETREEKTDDQAALDKIKELARRQDELNRQQQEAAKQQGASEEELKRQLERLTREQGELRRQAEELSQQLQQSQQGRQGQGGQGGRGGQGAAGGAQERQQASRELQKISEEMQGAASELRRDNPQQASERGSRAAERLRDLEQRMRSAQPDDRRRAVGEMQLESKQIADAQRKLANDTKAADPAAGSDASRRRAGEQGRLADRTERLERSLEQLASGQGGDERQRNVLAEAARELDRQQLADRMRKAAQEGQPRSRDGREQQEIASALDRLAERLGAANGPGAQSQQLSEELSRIRELREKLAQLDRQLAEMKNQPNGRGRGEGQESGEGRGRGGKQAQGRGDGEAQGARGSGSQNGSGDAPWEQARELLEQLQQESAGRLDSPSGEGFNPGRSAPGTEGWKQDFAAWDALKVQIAVALERAESSTAARLRDQQSKDRLSAGVTQAVPDQYKRLVEQYYRALASKTGEGR